MEIKPAEKDYIDIHSHSPETGTDIFRILNVMVNDPDSWLSVRPISIGLHPWYISDESTETLDSILTGSVHLPHVKAIGETGLDRLCKTSMDLQEEIFVSHIEMAVKTNKPLIIHCVRAYSELIRLRKTFNSGQSWIIHGFNGSSGIAGELVEKGFYLSFGPRMLNDKAKSRELAKVIPVDRIFIETDDAEIPLHLIYTEVAGLYNKDLSSFREMIRHNYSEVFNE